MASLRNTVSSTLGTVVTAADAVTQSINTAVIGVDMLNKWAQNEQSKQKANLKYDAAIVEKEAKQRALMKITDLNLEVANYISKSDVHAAAWVQAEAELAELMK